MSKPSEREIMMYDYIGQVIDGTMSKSAAAAKLGLCVRSIERRCYQRLFEGCPNFAHKSRGRAAYNRSDAALYDEVLRLYKREFSGYNFTHFHQKLVEVKGMNISYASVYRFLSDGGYRSPKARKSRKGKTLHPTRPRRAKTGEMLQLDASKHVWFGADYCHLHASIDDATGTVTGAHFEREETIFGYYQVMKQTLRDYGIPEELYTDRRTVFASTKTKSSSLELDTGTQFRIAAAKLGIARIHLTSVPQAKGRVERLFQTFQDRLISEMRSATIDTAEEANLFLPSFIADHNARYALDSSKIESAFGPTLSEAEINIALSIVDERKIGGGGTLSYRNICYAPFTKKNKVVLPSKTKVIVLKSLDDKLYAAHGEQLYTLLRVPSHQVPTPKDVARNIYTPPKDHPWREVGYRILLEKFRKAS